MSTLRVSRSFCHYMNALCKKQQLLLLPSSTVSCRSPFSYRRVLDMGGAPSSFNDKTRNRINTSKNCKLQAICFEFELLTRNLSAETEQGPGGHSALPASSSATSETFHEIPKLNNVQPNANMIQQVANLLNVNLGDTPSSRKTHDNVDDDDLSLLTGTKLQTQVTPATSADGNSEHDSDNTQPKRKIIPDHNPLSDIRLKYVDKLSNRGVPGGLAQVELAKYQVEDSLKRGDASGHLAARKIAISNPVRTKSWMALTGTGALLHYLTQRSIRIVLLPRLGGDVLEDDAEAVGERMEDFKKQLNDVVFDLLIKDGRPGGAQLIQTCLQNLQLNPNLILMVSDRDDYLRAAKEASMMTCRILPPNAPRGNVSAHYTASTIPEVQEVVNEINGISFRAVLNKR